MTCHVAARPSCPLLVVPCLLSAPPRLLSPFVCSLVCLRRPAAARGRIRRRDHRDTAGRSAPPGCRRRNQVGSSVTVITAERDRAEAGAHPARRSAAMFPASMSSRPAAPAGPPRSSSAAPMPTTPRSDRRHRRQRSEHARRRLRLLAVLAADIDAGRGAARAAERPLWLRRHRRRDQHHHQDRLGSGRICAACSKAAPSAPSTRRPVSAVRWTASATALDCRALSAPATRR